MQNNQEVEERHKTRGSRKSQPRKKYPVMELFLSAAAVFFMGVLLRGGINDSSFFSTLCTAISCLLITIGGIFIILQKEAPRTGLPNITGVGAVITGIAAVVTFGSASLILFYELLKEIVGK